MLPQCLVDFQRRRLEYNLSSQSGVGDMPVASVVIPTYNQKVPLRITLASFDRQMGVDGLWELILVDDGSTDGTAAMLASLKTQLPLVYLSRQHGGRAAARNTGLAQASGSIAVFCDGDRAVCNHFVETHLWHFNSPGAAW